MKNSILLVLWALGVPSIHAKPILEGDEIDSHESAFHHAIHRSAGFYLVCIYEVRKKPWNTVWEQLEIKATVVDAIKGGKPVGEKINFQRVIDGKYGDVSHMVGSLYFVRYDHVESATPADRRSCISILRIRMRSLEARKIFKGQRKNTRRQNNPRSQTSDKQLNSSQSLSNVSRESPQRQG